MISYGVDVLKVETPVDPAFIPGTRAFANEGGRFVTWIPPSRDELKPENVFFRSPKVSFSLEKLPTSQLSLR